MPIPLPDLFTQPPTLQTVIQQLLGSALSERYPALVVDLSTLQLAIPSPRQWQFRPLMAVVQDYLGGVAPLDFSDVGAQDYYLSERPPTRLKYPDATRSRLDIKAIETLIKELPQTLPTALQNALVEYWNADAERCRRLADALLDRLRIAAIRQVGLTAQARSTVDQLVTLPDREQRVARHGERAVYAYCLETLLTHDARQVTLLGPELVLTQTGNGVAPALLCTPAGAIEVFASMDDLLQAWGQRLAAQYNCDDILIRRYEPQGNVFDHQATMLLNRQQERLGAWRLPATNGFDALQTEYLALCDPEHYLSSPAMLAPAALEPLRAKLPAWLQQAGTAAQARYRRLSLGLASAKLRSGGRTFLSDIPDIRTFATEALRQALQKDAAGDAPDPDDLELIFAVAAGYPGTAGIVKHEHMSLTDLAIRNLAGRPHGELSIRHRQGLALPAWLTPQAVLGSGGLIEQVDIGQQYPRRLQTELLGDTPQARARETLFADQQSLQLPLLALELSLQNRHGLTLAGARRVEALMQPEVADQQVDGQRIVIRHLTLVRSTDATPDAVANMYLIEGKDPMSGPHLLYRPLYAEPLYEFASRAALFEAIATPGELQSSVLLWLSDAARPIYDHGGFREPHYVRFGLGDEFAVIRTPAPAHLGANGTNDELHQYLISGRLLQYLYTENANAMIRQADRESLSNHESRWQLLLEGGGLLFGSVLYPLLRGPAMLTGWLLSLIASFSMDIEALEADDPKVRELATVDLLLNLGQILLEGTPPTSALGAARRDIPALPLPARVAEQWPAPAGTRIREGVVHLPGVLPQPDKTVLDFSFAQARHRLTPEQQARLASFKVQRPATLPTAIEDGPHKGLYRDEPHWYARVAGEWFRVTLDGDTGVTVVDPDNPQRLGPPLRVDEQGNWSVDTRLRLRGGMPPKRIQAARLQRAQRIDELRAAYERFVSAQVAQQRTVDIAHSVMERASEDPRFTAAQQQSTRERFDKVLQEQTTDYLHILDAHKERQELGIPLPSSTLAALMENLVNNARKHVVVAEQERMALYSAHTQFLVQGPQLYLSVINAPARYEAFIKQSLAINERSIRWLEMRDRYRDELFNLGLPGAEGYARLVLDRPDEISALAVKDLQIRSLKLVVIKHLEHTLFETLDEVLTPLQSQVRTHSELNALELSAQERVTILQSLVERYGSALDALQGIGIINRDELESTYFSQLFTLVESLYQEAARQFAGELKPVVPAAKRPARRKTSMAGKPTKKIIRTARRGTLIGELKPIGNVEVVEVRDEVGNQLLDMYSQSGDEWVVYREQRPPQSPRPSRALSLIKGEARKLFAMLEAHLRRGKDYKKVSRHPQEVEEILHFEATRYTKLATELDQAIQAQPQAARLAADQALVTQMLAAAQQLIELGTELRIALCLELPPTHGNLDYLAAQKRAYVARWGERLQLSGERRDFIQEYAITDPKGQPLWYAHFHYPAVNTPKADYSAAHLKTREQRQVSYYTLLASAQGPQAVVNVHRGLIGKALAERLFLPLAP